VNVHAALECIAIMGTICGVLPVGGYFATRSLRPENRS
jgi:hypothetical protein